MTSSAPAPLRFVIYVRCSTTSQLLDGYGLDVQEADSRALVAALNGVVIRVCSDGAVSGKTEAVDRPGMSCAINAVRDGEADAVVVASLSRIGRELMVQEACLALLWKLGGRVFTVDTAAEVPADDPDDYMRTAFRQLLGIMNQIDRSALVSRMAKGRSAKRAGGDYAGGFVPLGKRVERDDRGRSHFAPDPQGQAAIARMHALRAQGHALRSIAAQLAQEGVRTARGGHWTAATVSRILRRSEASAAA